MTPGIVATGLGAICSAGPDAHALGEAVAAGRGFLVPLQDPRYRPSHGVMAGLAPAVLEPAHIHPPGWPKPDRFAELALVAAEQAIRQARIDPARLGRRMAVVVGTCSGPTTLLERHYQAVLNGTPDRSPDQAFRLGYESAARLLARTFGIRGFTGTVTTACSSALTAIGTGMDLIHAGLCDAVLVGGADAFNLSTQIGFDGLKAPSDAPCAPFSKPVGLSLGEGAAFFVLERHDFARARGAPILAAFLGFGSSNDAYHSSAPDPSGRGQALAVDRALHHAGIAPEEVAYINAHGTGTLANDKAETKVIRRVFGPGADALPVSSQKGVFGHTLGAAGAIELAGTILCREAGVLPPTAHFRERREGCDLDYVAEPGRPFPADRLWLKENFAFGGHNAALVLGPPPPEVLPPASAPPPRICLVSMGLVSPAGLGDEAFVRLLAGSGPELRDCAPPGHRSVRAALVPDALDPNLERRLGLRRMDKATALGALAAQRALTGAGLSLRPEELTDVGLFLGHASGSNAAEATFLAELLANNYVLQRVTDFTQVVPNATAGAICRVLGLRGHHAACCFGEGAGLMSLVAGACAMANRHAPFLLAGAIDTLEARGWGHFIPVATPPPAEGAVFFLLEAEDHLRQRGGRALATIAGMAVATDAAEWNAPPAEALAREVAADALRQAGLAPNDPGQPCDVAADVAARTGWAEACGPLFDLAAALLQDRPRPGLSRPLLHSIRSRQGPCASVVFAPFSDSPDGSTQRKPE
jgi:3-oxoacyl-[acyl-carrier-protein] synthase II